MPRRGLATSSAFQNLGIGRLSADERFDLAHDIWDGLVGAAAPLTEAQRREVDARLAADRANPEAALPWEQVEAEALARLRR